MHSTIEILQHARISEAHCSLKHCQFRNKQEAGNENHLKLIAVSSYFYWPQTNYFKFFSSKDVKGIKSGTTLQ